MKTANKLESLTKGVDPRFRKPAWRLAVRASRGYGRLTARFRVLPDYLILGTQRGGTTTLQKHLTQHPRVKSARLSKGVHFFDVNYERGELWYRSHFRTGSGRRIVGGPYPMVVGEASPYYLFHPLAPSRIRSTLPDAKLIVLLRDPVTRAFSHHRHEVTRGFEDLDFEKAIEAEPSRLAGEEERIIDDPGYVSHAHQHHSYLARGLYDIQLRRYLDHFPANQIFVAESADLFRQPEELYERLLRFLELEPYAPDYFEQLNPTTGSTRVEPSTYARLREYFAESDERLSEIIGQQPSWAEIRSSDGKH